ncbi:MAG TPA: hypothetical protein VFC90_06710 [Planctomycetota bacterium]|nr:hypothetical protein [Planctomycetota bacterium]
MPRGERIRAAVAALLLLAAWTSPPQDPDPEFAEKVRALIVQLKDRNIGLKRKAEEDLFQLGPPALPILREAEAGLAAGELRLKVNVIIRRIERLQRHTIASGSPLLVTLVAKDRPIPEVLAELQQKTSVPIDHRAVPADAVTSLEADKLSLWEAVDRICAAHGKLAWDVSDKGIAIRRETYVRPFMATNSGYLLLVRPFLKFPPGPGTGDRDYVRGEAVVAGPPGAQSIAQFLTYEVLADDKGTNLLTSAAGLIRKPVSGEYRMLPEPDMTRPLVRPVAEWLDAAPARGAAKVKSCKGVATLQAVLDMERSAFVSGPNLKKGAKEGGESLTLEIESVDVSGGRVRMQVMVTDARLTGRREQKIFYPQTRGKLVLRDAAGKEIPADVEMVSTGPTPGSKPGTQETTVFKLQAALKDGTKLEAIELFEPIGVTDIKIPFEFKDIPMRKVK